MKKKNGRFYQQNFLSFWKIFKVNKLGLIGAIILSLFILISIFHPWFSPYDPTAPYFDFMDYPSSGHLFGTDQIGRDILSRVLYGTKISMFIGITAAAIAVIIGTIIGLISGYYGGVFGELLMRFTDMFLSLPYFPLMIILAALLGRSLLIIVIVIGVTSWPSMARIIRSEVLSLKERPFVERARAIGSGNFYIIRKYILPNVLPLVTANAILVIPLAIIAEATLSFLGLGDPTTISWGSIINDAFNNNAIMLGAWWFFIPPGLAIVFLSLSFALIGHALDEVLNPKLKKEK